MRLLAEPGRQRSRFPFADRITQRRHKPDYWLVVISAILVVLGLVVIYSISPGLAEQYNVSGNYFVDKQLIAVALSIIAFIVIVNLPVNIWRRLQTPLIVAAFIASIAVRFLGKQAYAQYGAYRWIQIGGFSFQASELIKFALLVWLAAFLVDKARQGKLSDSRATLWPLLIVLALIGIIVAKFQSDLGSTAVMVAMMGAMVYVIGMPMKKILIIGGVILVLAVLAISTTPYRRQRLLTFLHPASDCQNHGYQACQALITVGSGGVFGQGVANGAQAYGYLPEAENDSIFAIYAEKFGFIGSAILVVLFAALFARMKTIAERAPDDYSRLLVIGILAWFSIQTFINIGAMIGVLPLKGITLPFISYGGTSMLFAAIALAVVFQVSRYTTYGRITEMTTAERTWNDHPVSRGRDGRPHYTVTRRRP